MLNLQNLNNISRAMKYSKGTVFDNSAGAQMYIILQGEAGVIISQPGEHRLTGKLSSGDFFGESSLFLDVAVPGSVVALTDLIAIPLSRETAVGFFREEPSIAYNLCQTLCERLHGQSFEVKPALTVDKAPERASVMDKPAADKKQEAAATIRKSVITQQSAPPEVPKPAPASRPAPVPDAVSVSQIISTNPGVFPLFPEGHASDTLSLHIDDREHLMEKESVCPLCKKSFRVMAVRPSRLMLENTDSDMRQRYKDIEPLYYDVITCPHCLYSALTENFNKPGHPKAGFDEELQAIRHVTGIKFGLDKDTDSVYAGYYLALFAAPYCFPKHQMVVSKLLLKLSRIYQDGKNEEMEMQTTRQALDSYMFVYQNFETTPGQDQQLCLVIGELNLKLGHTNEAKNFFFSAKTNRAGTPLLKRQAENRLFDIRDIV